MAASYPVEMKADKVPRESLGENRNKSVCQRLAGSHSGHYFPKPPVTTDLPAFKLADGAAGLLIRVV